MYVAYTPQLDLSSCGGAKGKALKNLKEAVRLFLEEAGYLVKNDKLEGPINNSYGFFEPMASLCGPHDFHQGQLRQASYCGYFPRTLL